MGSTKIFTTKKRSQIGQNPLYAYCEFCVHARADVLERADFFSIQSESKFHGGLLKKSSRADQPLLSNLLRTISPSLMPILKFAAKHQWKIQKDKKIVHNTRKASTLISIISTVDRAGLERTQVGESAPSRLEGGSTSAGADKV